MRVLGGDHGGGGWRLTGPHVVLSRLGVVAFEDGASCGHTKLLLAGGQSASKRLPKVGLTIRESANLQPSRPPTQHHGGDLHARC